MFHAAASEAGLVARKPSTNASAWPGGAGLGSARHDALEYAGGCAAASHHAHVACCAGASVEGGIVNRIGVVRLATAMAWPVPAALKARRMTPPVFTLSEPPCASNASDRNSVLTGVPPAADSAPVGSGSNELLLPGALMGAANRRGESGASSATAI